MNTRRHFPQNPATLSVAADESGEADRITPDRWIIGSFTDVLDEAPGKVRPSRAHFFRIPANQPSKR